MGILKKYWHVTLSNFAVLYNFRLCSLVNSERVYLRKQISFIFPLEFFAGRYSSSGTRVAVRAMSFVYYTVCLCSNVVRRQLPFVRLLLFPGWNLCKSPLLCIVMTNKTAGAASFGYLGRST